MKDNLIKSYEENKSMAIKWMNTAIRDIEIMKDNKECIRSLCAAYEYAGKARQCAVILSHDYGISLYRFEIHDVISVQLENAKEKVIGSL